MSYGIVYEITCVVTGKRYIGQTVLTLRKRWNGHVGAAKKGIGWALSEAIRQYGERSFTTKILCECESKQELNVKERQFIKEFGTVLPNGYNMTNGGEGPCELTRKLISERTKEAMSKIPDDVREKQKERQHKGMIGHKVTDEAKRNMSSAAIKRGGYGPLSSKHKKKLSLSGKGRRHSEESKEKMRNNRRGKCVGDDHPMRKDADLKERIRKKLIGRQMSDATRLKIGQANSLHIDVKSQIESLLARGTNVSEITKRLNVSRSSVYRIKKLLGSS